MRKNDEEVNIAIIARKDCGCVVAADLDRDPRTIRRYLERGYIVDTVCGHTAKRLIRESNCKHGSENRK